jgi:hypothetical protein
MNRVGLSHANGTPAGVPDGAAAAGRPHDPRDPWLGVAAAGLLTSPLAGEPGHGCTAALRRQPVLIVAGRAEHADTDAFELICCECGDNPYLDYSQISPRLQQIRGPYTLAAGLAAYEQHLGLTADSPVINPH